MVHTLVKLYLTLVINELQQMTVSDITDDAYIFVDGRMYQVMLSGVLPKEMTYISSV